jgi:hypothetical protein
MKKLIFASLFILISLSAFAKTDEVMIIKNDLDSNLVIISIESDNSGKFLEMRKVQTTVDKKVLSDEKFSLSDLSKGATALVRKGKEVVKIKFSANFDSMYGGSFDMDYLYNGIKGTRRQLQLDLGKNGSKWEVTKNNKVAKNLNVIAKRAALVGAIGIEEIKF